jgi:hypothetical protein
VAHGAEACSSLLSEAVVAWVGGKAQLSWQAGLSAFCRTPGLHLEAASRCQ